MNIIFFDIETTGLPKGGHDPRIVQLAAILSDDNGRTMDELNVIIKPDGWVIPSEAARIHGITTERATKHGVPIAEAITRFHRMVDESFLVVAHNLPFDSARYRREVAGLCTEDRLAFRKGFCTMTRATPIMKLPPTENMMKWGRGNQFKNPNLQEAHKFFIGKEFTGAHDALADVRACKAVFFAMKERGFA